MTKNKRDDVGYIAALVAVTALAVIALVFAIRVAQDEPNSRSKVPPLVYSDSGARLHVV